MEKPTAPVAESNEIRRSRTPCNGVFPFLSEGSGMKVYGYTKDKQGIMEIKILSRQSSSIVRSNEIGVDRRDALEVV